VGASTPEQANSRGLNGTDYILIVRLIVEGNLSDMLCNFHEITNTILWIFVKRVNFRQELMIKQSLGVDYLYLYMHKDTVQTGQSFQAGRSTRSQTSVWH
jgi:hypothetical protein